MQIALQVEGQRGVTWPVWQRFAAAVEQLGFHGLYRSDHFYDADPPEQDSLGLWPSLTWLASHTQRIEFGSLVTPLSFRHPVHTARMARDVDDLSGGRLVLGVGAGWGGGWREHQAFGFDLLDTPARFARFTEGLDVITQLLRSGTPVDFAGQYYQLQGAQLLPRPSRLNGPPILIGGNGPKLVLPLAARFADEWNSIFRSPEQFSALNQHMDELLVQYGREPGTVIRSQMKGLVFGVDQQDLTKKLQGKSVDDFVARGLIAGTANQIVDQIHQWAAIGLQKIMLQWSDLSAFDQLEFFAQNILSQITQGGECSTNNPIVNNPG